MYCTALCTLPVCTLLLISRQEYIGHDAHSPQGAIVVAPNEDILCNVLMRIPLLNGQRLQFKTASAQLTTGKLLDVT